MNPHVRGPVAALSLLCYPRCAAVGAGPDGDKFNVRLGMVPAANATSTALSPAKGPRPRQLAGNKIDDQRHV
jgi:hypothetical protein